MAGCMGPAQISWIKSPKSPIQYSWGILARKTMRPEQDLPTCLHKPQTVLEAVL